MVEAKLPPKLVVPSALRNGFDWTKAVGTEFNTDWRSGGLPVGAGGGGGGRRPGRVSIGREPEEFGRERPVETAKH